MRLLDEIEESSWQTVNAKKRVASKKENGTAKTDEAGAKYHEMMGDAASIKINTPSEKDSATSRKTNSTAKKNVAASGNDDGVVMGMKVDTSEADDGEAITGEATLNTVGSDNAQSEFHTHGSFAKGTDGTKTSAVDEQDVQGVVTEPSVEDTTATDTSIIKRTSTPETAVKQPTLEGAIKKEDEKPRKKKKGEYLPYKDKPHPQDSDWAVV